MKTILVISNIAVGVIFAALIGLQFVPDRGTSILIVNSLVSILMLTLCGAYLREGVKFYRMLETFTQVKPLMRKLTVILIGSSTMLIVTILVLILATVIRAIAFPDSNIACQISQAIYRSIEFSVIILLGYPLRTYGQQETSESYASNRTPSISVHLEMKTIESKEESETKSDQSEESSATSSENNTE